MKKSISFILCCVLIFSSFSFVFADFGSGDSTNLLNLYNRANSIWNYINNYMPTFNQISTISGNVSDIYTRLGTINTSLGTLSNISSTLTTISSALNYGSHNITYWVNAINSWMSPIYNAITNVPVDLSTIIGALGYYTDDGTTYHPYLNDMYSLMTFKGLTGNNISLFNPTWDWGLSSTTFTPYEDQLKNFLYFDVQKYNGFVNAMSQLLKYTNHSRYYTNWATLQRTQMDNYSFGDGVLNFLDKIQQPVARLSYVLASDERISAQEAAAANEEAVVNNFIDSSGNGATSPSNIGSMSDLSSGYKQNFGSDASPTGIFDIFNSDHATWFSQETKNQLDTTTPSRMTKGSVSDTPLLDKQIQDIYDALGVKQP